jgi:trigger factor
MRVTRTDQSPTKITLKVEAEAADLEPIRKHVLSHFKNVKVPGFRVGKAPARMVEQSVGQQQYLDEFMEHALNELYRRAVDDEAVRPISQPDVQIKKFVPYTTLEFEAQTEILGPVKLPNYKAIKVAKKKPEVTAKEVDEVVENLRTRASERAEVTRVAKEGDELVIDFAGTDEQGQPLSGGAGQDYPIVLGSKTFIPGFEENLIGTKAGQTKEFKLTFPKDYGVETLQNKKVDFKVDIKKVQELQKPKLDDDFATKSGPFKTVKELKADVKKQLLAEKLNQATIDHQNEIVRKIAEKTQIEVPKSLVDEENLRLEEQEKQNLAYRGQTWQDHLKTEGITEDQHRQRHYAEAEERVKVGLILSEIAEKENISVSPEELNLRLQILKGQYQDPQMQAELDKPENQRDIQARLLTEKTLDKLVHYVQDSL